MVNMHNNLQHNVLGQNDIYIYMIYIHICVYIHLHGENLALKVTIEGGLKEG